MRGLNGRSVKSRLSKLAGWLLAWGLIGPIGALAASSPEAPVVAFSNFVLADFDGDARWDLALGRPERRGYHIRVHLSRRAGAVSLRVSVREVGLVLLALDVNRDAHPDLVVASAHLARLLAVWVNDGRGTFRRGGVRGWAFGLSRTVGCTGASARRAEIAWNAEDRWPVDRPTRSFVIHAPEFSAFLPWTWALPSPARLVTLRVGRSPPSGRA